MSVSLPDYATLGEADWNVGPIRPMRYCYKHTRCNTTTTMSADVANTFARRPDFYTHTYCFMCETVFPVSEFLWKDDHTVVGT